MTVPELPESMKLRPQEARGNAGPVEHGEFTERVERDEHAAGLAESPFETGEHNDSTPDADDGFVTDGQVEAESTDHVEEPAPEGFSEVVEPSQPATE
jgi:hypothetical protein